MDIEFKMPDLATTDSSIKVIRWLVQPGQIVTRGQALLEVETDKATMEVESIATGQLKSVHAQPGEALVAGQLIAVIAGEGVAAPPVAPPAAAPAPASPPPRPGPAFKPAGGMFAKNRAAAKRPDAP
ncbi:MAG: lipoyl domain-containing protein [Verrucomicrobia bacterium]|nr:lipoyl domain-containing protein [Verrucomicrobiota bacterium]